MSYPRSSAMDTELEEEEESEGYDLFRYDYAEDEYIVEARRSYKVENFMVDGKHFSHDHPLQMWYEDEEASGDGKVCRICSVPIICSASYTCTIGCKFFLHRECALKLPPRLIHHTHYHEFDPEDKHILYLRFKKGISCNFTYECGDCEFSIHPLAAVPNVVIKTQHKSHPSHPLVAICKQVLCECDACGEEQDGFFFSCSQGCNFWIHSTCATLPNIAMIPTHPHPFILAFSLPLHAVDGRCIICKKRLVKQHHGVYFCPQSTNFAHITCAVSKIKSRTETKLELIQLPDDESNIFPSLIIRRYTEMMPSDVDFNSSYYVRKKLTTKKLTIEYYHNHPLILTDHGSRKVCCDLCTKPINMSSPFYRCTLQSDCRFAAHTICADIFPILNFFIPDTSDTHLEAEPCRDNSSWFNSIFHCLFCHRPCNGLCFRFPDVEWEEGSPSLIDLECMVAPSIISHTSHPQHLLFRTHRLGTETPLTCCPHETFFYDVYRCIECELYIHINCAMLPKSVRYESYHHHNLYLVFTRGQINAGLCEVCEKEIDLNHWFYGCDECDQWFHINCIPSVGHLSKVKFGGTSSFHPHCHPLALTRMLKLPSQRCNFCHQIIQGMVDQIAFYCANCHFWIHFFCARDSVATTSPTKTYLEVDDQLICAKFKVQI